MSANGTKQIGRYRILGELGRGAMGVVYRAEDPALDRVVALKTIALSDEAEGRADYTKRFFLEAKAAGKLNHPNIITTYDFGEADGVAYMAMELLEGTELRERMKDGALPPAEALEIARQVAEGLKFAHERGVVHRDVKPANIMLLPGGQAKIMDFGIARVRAADYKTSTGMVLGTPKYMSPEQVTGTPVDHRSDIFSLGIVLYEMLTGTRLFDGNDVAQIAHGVVTLDPEAPSQSVRGLPSMLDFVVARALKKDPAVRYQETGEFAADLAECLAELRAHRPEDAGAATDSTRTVRLDAAEPPAAPAARSIGDDTRLPLARRLDSSAALARLAAPSRSDARAFRRRTRPVGLLRRVCFDPAVRRLAVIVVLAAWLGGAIAL